MARSADKKDDWCTPPKLWKFGLDVFGVEQYALDPAANRRATVPAIESCYGPEDAAGQCGLSCDWFSLAGHGPIWLNHPWGADRRGTSKSEIWIGKAVMEARRGCRIIALSPVKIETGWWQDLIATADGIAFIRHRPKFVNPDTGTTAQTGWSAAALSLWSPDRLDRDRFHREAGARNWWSIVGRWRR